MNTTNTTSAEQIYLAPLEYYHRLTPAPLSSRIVLLLIFGVVSPLGVVSNMLACVVLVKSRLVRNSTYSFMFSLSLANALTCLVMALTKTVGIITERPVFGLVGNIIVILLTASASYTSMLSFFSSAIHTFMRVVFNRQLTTCTKYPVVVIVSLWVLAFVLNVILLLAVNSSQLVVYIIPTNVIYALELNTPGGMAVYIVTIVAPIVFIAVCVGVFLAIYCKLRTSAKRVHATTNQSGGAGKQAGKEKTIAFKLFVLCFVFVLTYLPVVVFLIITFFVPLRKLTDLYIAILSVPVLIYAAYPMLYLVLFPDIKIAFYKHVLRRKEQSIETQTSNTGNRSN